MSLMTGTYSFGETPMDPAPAVPITPLPTCPTDGSTLIANASTWQTPPWYCATCSRCWWNAELTATARAAWRPTRQDFRPVQFSPVSEEVARACQRGCSVTPTQVGHISPAQARSLLALQVRYPVAALLATRGRDL